MTTEPTLFTRRLGELTELITAHLERGSLDEGNATAFDPIIDAWLDEEAAGLTAQLLEQEEAAEAVRAAQHEARAAAEAEADRRRDLQHSAELRWESAVDRYTRRRAAAEEALRAGYDARVAETEARLDEARVALTSARDMLLGSPHGTAAPLAGAPGPEPDGIVGTDEEKAA